MNLFLRVFGTFILASLLIISLSCDSATPNVNSTNSQQRGTDSVVNNYFPEGMIVEKPESESGIFVIGEGSLKVKPDIAIVNMGIQVERSRASLARKDASQRMQDLMAAIAAVDIDDKDIQTSYFNVSPKYDWIEEKDESGRHFSKQVLVGYTVTNNVMVTVRDLDIVSKVIDAAAEASGDSIRINNVSFQIDNSIKFQTGLRELAYRDALDKAQHFSSLAGVKLGKVLMISEVNLSVDAVMPRNKMAFAQSMEFAGDYSTPISPGETDLNSRVSVLFEIK